MKPAFVLFSVALTAAAAVPAAGPAPTPGAAEPLTALPYTPVLEPAFLDRAVDPCVDLYTFACGGWLRAHPVPPDRSRWSVYGKLHDENLRYLWGLLEQAARPEAGRDPDRARVGDFYAACMDAGALDRAGAGPLAADLDAVAALASKPEIAALLGRLHAALGDHGTGFGFGVDQDPGDATQVIAFVSAGGLGLPDRDYYFGTDAHTEGLRTAYRAHVERTLALLGDPPERARAGAAAVLRLETELARAALTNVEKRDPHRVYHRSARAELEALTPAFRWADYLEALGAGPIATFNVTEPAFFRVFDGLLATESLKTWRSYLRWHLARTSAPFLSEPFRALHFDFYGRTLRGIEQRPPRWRECVEQVDEDLGEALGRQFVERAFPAAAKSAAEAMTGRIVAAMAERLRALEWMGAETRARALEKLSALRTKIGYPERWRDYSTLEVRRDDFYGDVTRAARFETRRQLAKIGRPVDRGEWGMTPPTVNAYYNASMNDMNFPAGVLLPPLFDPRLDAAPNYGNTGATIGHELTHGFDDEGRQFDARGNLRDWWTPADAAAFVARAQCVADQYARYPVIDELEINSRLTLGEDVADLGGTILAWEAWRAATAGERLAPRDGLTPEQRFFVGFAQWACENQRPEELRLNAATNPHSPSVWRINGVVANMPEFAAAFDCRPGQPLVRPPAASCRIW